MRCLIVGMAKSGTTALTYSIAGTLHDPRIYFEEKICDISEIPAIAVSKIIFGLEDDNDIIEFSKRFDRFFLIVRDPRDNLISRLMYTLAGNPRKIGDDGLVTDFVTLLKQKQRDPDSVDVVHLIAMVEPQPDRLIGDAVAIGHRFADFLERAEPWTLVRYETMVAGDLRVVSDVLGKPVQAGVTIDSTYARVSRTNGSGDWRHWLTARDVSRLRGRLNPVAERLGYVDDWTLLPDPSIRPEHSWRYAMRLITERRRHYGLPPLRFDATSAEAFGALRAGMGAGSAKERAARQEPRQELGDMTRPDAVGHGSHGPLLAPAACPVCGGERFGPGPGGRTARNGRMPACMRCGTLERARALYALVRMLSADRLAARHALAYGNVAHLDPTWFRSWTQGGDTIPDPIAVADGSIGLLVIDHVLEYTGADREAFDRLVRVLAPDGILLACFSDPQARPKSRHMPDDGTAKPLRHLYGHDLSDHFACASKNVLVLTVDVVDSCTDVSIRIYVFLKNIFGAMELKRELAKNQAMFFVQQVNQK